MQKLFPLFLVFLLSCGEQQTSSRMTSSSQSPIYQNSNEGIPVLLSKQSSNCQTAFDQDYAFDLNLVLSGQEKSVHKNFNNYFVGYNLADHKSEIISRTFYGQVLRYWELPNNRIRIEDKNIPTLVTACPEIKNYDRDSVESAALNVNYYIQQANHKIKTILPQISLPPVAINISPSFQKITQSSGRTRILKTQTDNAMYDSETNEIIFLPQSEDAQKLIGHHRLWEIPGVIVHEYAHHLFSTITTSGIPLNKSNTIFTRGCFHSHNMDNGVQQVSTFSHDISFAVDSLNEGFADLMAFYILAREEQGFLGLGDHGEARNIYNENYGHGFKKIFFPGLISYTDDPHLPGAFFAYQAEKILQHLGASNEQKINILVHWVSLMSDRFLDMQDQTANDYLENALVEFIKFALTSFNQNTPQKICQLLRQSYLNSTYERNHCSGLPTF